MKPDLLRTSAVRAAAAFALVFLAGSAAVLGSIFLITSHAIDTELDAVLLAEEEGLLEDYRQGGSAAVATDLTQRMDSWGRNGALYLLVEPGLARVAGNLDHWPFDGVPAVNWPEFTVLARAGREQVRHPVRARLSRLPDGNLLLIGTDLSERQAFAGRFATAIGWGIGLTALLAAAAGWSLSRSMVRRVAGVAGSCQSILDGDLSMRLPVSPAGDEFDMLALAVNQVLARLEEQTRVLKTTLDSVAHDLRGPLHRLRTRLEDAGRSSTALPPATAAALQDSLRDIDRVRRTLATLLEIAQARSGAGSAGTQTIDLAALTRDVGELFEPVARERGMTLAVVNDGAATAIGNRQLLAQLLANLVENAVAYGRDGGRVEIRTATASETTSLSVADDGPGIPESERERVLQPFVRLHSGTRTDSAGLGLSLVAAIAGMHHATLELADNRPGLRVTLGFGPRAHRAAPGPECPDPAATLQAATGAARPG
jgi:signal transduction histidine kinase